MKIACIANPSSGGGKHLKKLTALRTQLQRLYPHLVWEETKGTGHATELATQLATAGMERLVIVGGDGTLSEAVNGLMPLAKERRPALALLAYGTGGDYSRTLKDLSSFKTDPSWLKSAREVFIDVGCLEMWDGDSSTSKTRYFVNIGDIGLPGEVVRLVNRGKKSWGALEYPKSALLSALGYQHSKVQIHGLTPMPQKTELLTLVFAKGRYFGGGMCIAPDTQLDDGLFQVVMIPKVSYLSLLALLPQTYFKKRLSHSKISYHQVSSFEVNSLAGPMPIDLDGEFFEAQGIRAQVMPRALRMLLPN